MEEPLVTIIGLSYNHAPYLQEALDSVRLQTYPHLQVILVDDGSSDNSAQMLLDYARDMPGWDVIILPDNEGNCRAFNVALQQAKGEFVIDFALDDVLLPDRVAQQVAAFAELDERYGVLYTDAFLIDQRSRPLGLHFYKARKSKVHWPPPAGDVFADVLARHFISAPTMMIRRQVLQELGGYDEQLAYEDFDFWVRSARKWWYGYLDEPLTKKRIWQGSMSQSFFRKRRLSYFQTTLIVCAKAAALITTDREKEALVARIRFEARQALFTEHREVIPEYMELLRTHDQLGFMDLVLEQLAKLPLPLAPLYRLYHRLRRSQQLA